MKKKLYIEFFLLIFFVTFVIYFLSYINKICGPFLEDLSNLEYDIYLVENYFSLNNVNGLLCNGSVLEHNPEINIFININKKIYFLFSQVLVFIISLFFIFIFKFNTIKFFTYIFILSFGIQVLFNINFGLNIWNEVFLNNFLFLCVLRLLSNVK